jgi:hypothetical protein
MSPAVALAADLATHLGQYTWLSFHVGDEAPEGAWTSRDELLADDAAGLAALVAMRQRIRPDVEAKLLWSDLVGIVGYPATYPVVRLLTRARRRPVLDPETLGLRVVTDDGYLAVRGIWYRSPRLQVLADDPLSGRPGIETVSSVDDMLATLVKEAEAFLAPLIEAVRRRASVGRRGLWGMAVDSLLWPVASQADDEQPDQPITRVERVLHAAAGTPLEHRADWLHFEHAGRRRVQIRNTSCCLAYKWPVLEGGGSRADGCDPRWNRYCMTCPLIPDGEAAHRARYWIDHPDEH